MADIIRGDEIRLGNIHVVFSEAGWNVYVEVEVGEGEGATRSEAHLGYSTIMTDALFSAMRYLRDIYSVLKRVDKACHEGSAEAEIRLGDINVTVGCGDKAGLYYDIREAYMRLAYMALES